MQVWYIYKRESFAAMRLIDLRKAAVSLPDSCLYSTLLVRHIFGNCEIVVERAARIMVSFCFDNSHVTAIVTSFSRVNDG